VESGAPSKSPPKGETLTPVCSTYLVQGDTKSGGLSRTP